LTEYLRQLDNLLSFLVVSVVVAVVVLVTNLSPDNKVFNSILKRALSLSRLLSNILVVGSLNPSALAGGGFFIILGAAILYFGLKTPEGKKVNIGFGRYLDRYGICYTAITLLIIGLVPLIFGVIGNMP
jgi:hypothetical protein